MLDLDQGPNGDEAARAGWRRLDVEHEALVGGQTLEPSVRAVADNRPKTGQLLDPLTQELAAGDDVMWRAEQAAAATGNPRTSTSSVRLVPIVRPPCPPAWWKVGRQRAPRTVCASTMTIDGIGSRSWKTRTTAASRVIARAQTPFARQRRHCAQTAVQAP
jgi:hypothetical protein